MLAWRSCDDSGALVNLRDGPNFDGPLCSSARCVRYELNRMSQIVGLDDAKARKRYPEG